MSRTTSLTLGLTALVIGALVVASWVASPGPANASRKAAGHWQKVGCIKLELSQVCRDVYADDAGNLWMCAGCGDTKTANPGKCRQLSSAEVSSGSWCGGS